MSTSDALKLAQEEDPDGNRTIGIVTKVKQFLQRMISLD
jgi:hypothetical protein